MALSRRRAVQVAAVGALWRAISCAKHACGKRDSADGLRDLALCLDLGRITEHYETILAALQIAPSLRIRAAVLRRTLVGAYDTSTPLTRDQKHQQVAHSIGLLPERTITCRLLLFRRHRAHTCQHRKHRDADSTGPESPTAGPTVTSVPPDWPTPQQRREARGSLRAAPGAPGTPPKGVVQKLGVLKE